MNQNISNQTTSICSSGNSWSEEIILEIYAGEGGQDSKLLLEDFCSAYVKYAIRNNCKPEIVFKSDGCIGLLIKGKQLKLLFEDEAGKHCVQRVPPTERSGRVHTSMISVSVMPLMKQVSTNLKQCDLKIETTKGSGPGGQKKNKVESMVRITHLPTKITVSIDGRDQHTNKKRALQILQTRVHNLLKSQYDLDYNNHKSKQIDGGGRSNKIRTYNLVKYRAVDHRTNKKTKLVDEVFYKGRFELMKVNNGK